MSGYIGSIATKLTVFIEGINYAFVLYGLSALSRKASGTKSMLLLSSLFVMVASVLVYPFISGFDPYRINQQMLVVSSVGFIFGFKQIFTGRLYLFRRLTKFVVIVFLILQLVASSYLVYQMFGIHYSEIYNSDGLRYEKFYVHRSEIISSYWLLDKKLKNSLVLADYYGLFTYSQVDPYHARIFKINSPGKYIFLRYSNIFYKYFDFKYTGRISIFKYNIIFYNSDRVYTNGNTEIFKRLTRFG